MTEEIMTTRMKLVPAEAMDWRTDTPPKDGTAFYMRAAQIVRFLPYKPTSQQAKRGEIGRWQQMNEYGGWENCPPPLGNEWCLDTPSSTASPNGGKVSVKTFAKACKAASLADGPISKGRAFLEALGLELE